MGTTIRLDDDTKERLDDMMETGDYSSRGEAVEQLLDERAAKDRTIIEQRVTDSAVRELHENLGLEYASPISGDHARYIMRTADEHGADDENAPFSHLFTLASRSPMLFHPEWVGEVDGVSVYEVAADSYAFIYHHLAFDPKSHATGSMLSQAEVYGWTVPLSNYEDEVMNMVEAVDWVVPDGGIPDGVRYRGHVGSPLGGHGRTLTEEEEDQFYGLPTISEAVQEVNELGPEREEVDDIIGEILAHGRISQGFATEGLMETYQTIRAGDLDEDAIVEAFNDEYPFADGWEQNYPMSDVLKGVRKDD